MRQLPTGTVTFLFTDIEGSTRLLHEHGERYADLLLDHRRVLREVFERHGGVEVDTEGDAFFLAFTSASDALAAAGEAQSRLEHGPIRVRIGLHTGEAQLVDGTYVGLPVHLAARISAAAHGGQVVLSRTTRDAAGITSQLVDLGEHRLKDFDEPAWLFQLADGRFPPLKTIGATNLPRPASAFVGRRRELDELVGLLRSEARLLTLTGPGGSGKTRLAIEAAAEAVGEYPNGVYWVPLAPVHDFALVLETVAQTVGARDDLAAHFAGRRALILVDNFEHVLDAAQSLSALLTAAPGLDCLVTSRERLRIAGEQEYAVPPLDEPEAVDLFCRRSGLVDHDSIHELCRRLDNLPLAVELAAARTTVLRPAQILERLGGRLDLLKGGRDAEARHATLRATIAWSHDLCSPAEQSLFADLSVFAGGCALEASEQVCRADLDTLQSLVEKSLVRLSDGRFWMLETIREFATERRTELRPGNELDRRHADYLLDLLDGAETRLRGAEQTELVERLGQEHPNLRAALDWAHAHDGDLEAQLAGEAWYFWYLRGFFREGRDRLVAALAQASPGLPDEVRARLCDGLAIFAQLLGDHVASAARAEESLRLYRKVGSPAGILRALLNLQGAANRRGDLDQAEAWGEELVQRARSLGDLWYVAVGLGNLGSIALDRGQYARSHELYREAFDLSQQTGDEMTSIAFETMVGRTGLELGRTEDAGARFASALPKAHARGLAELLLWNFDGVAALAARTGAYDESTRLFAACEACAATIGWEAPEFLLERRQRILETIRASLSPEAFDAAWAAGSDLGFDDAVALATGTARASAQRRA